MYRELIITHVRGYYASKRLLGDVLLSITVVAARLSSLFIILFFICLIPRASFHVK